MVSIKIEKTFNNILITGIIFLVLLLPFHAFIKTVISSILTGTTVDELSSGSFLVAAWKEVLLILLVILVGIKSIITKKIPFKITKLDIFIILFFVLCVISIVFQTKDLSTGIWGLKTDFEFFVMYFVVRSIDFKLENLKTLLKIILGSALVVNLFGLLLVWILPDDFLMHFGYAPYISSYVDHKPIPIYHGLGEGLETMRLASTLSGPNQFGSYLLIILGLIIGLLVYKKTEIKNYWDKLIAQQALLWIQLGVAAICLVYTFSRAAWLGFAVLLLMLLVLLFKKKPKLTKIVLGIGTISIILNLILMVVVPNYIYDVWFHGISSYEHMEKTKEAVQIIAEHPLGLGLGMAGPVSRRVLGEENAIISENWYLQIAEETGIIGGLLFLGIIIMTIVYLYKAWHKEEDSLYKGLLLAAFLALIGLSINAIFLHTWDDSTTALLFWGLAGISVNRYLETKDITDKLKNKAMQFLIKN